MLGGGWGRALSGLLWQRVGAGAVTPVASAGGNLLGRLGWGYGQSMVPAACQVRGMANKRHKKIIKMAKGYRGRTNCFRIAVQKVERALAYAYRDRKVKKREFRSLWIQRLNAAVQQYGLSYNRFIPGLRAANITMDRKVLSELAVTEPYSFKAVVDTVKSVVAPSNPSAGAAATAAAKA